MRNFLVQKVKCGNRGQTLETDWQTTIRTESYSDAVQMGAFEYMHHIKDINDITVHPLGLWLYLVEENGFQTLYRLYNLDVETDI
ncbi:MAG: hypothetical protein ACPG5O_13565 [Pseudoalteromonas tetraodonis]